MSFSDQTLLLEIFVPDFQTPLIEPQTAVVGEGIEFEDVAQFDLPGGFATVNADFDITDDTIIYTIDDTRFSSFANVPTFNGYVFTDVDGTVLPILDIEVVEDSNTLEVPLEQIYFNENAVFVDVDALRFSTGDGIALQAAFASAEEAFSGTDQALFVARLYTATFGRDPDQNGLNFWIDAFDGAGGKDGLTEFFLLSDEFEARFGDPEVLPSEDLVGQLYENVLGRAGEADGIDFWVGLLDEGSVDRVDMLAFFVDSAENVENTARFDGLAQELGSGDWVLLL